MNEDLVRKKMENSLSHYEKELATLRTSRANVNILDNIYVDAYGSKTPVNQLSNISVSDPSTITVQVWDTGMIKNVENAIIESNLGINPQSDGATIRLPIPKLSEERRKELAKISSQYSETAKISIRNLRREFIELQKKNQKENNISEDQLKKDNVIIQKITDEFISTVEKLQELKNAEILKV